MTGTLYDQHCLRVETPARPLQVGILAVLDGRALVDPAGRLRGMIPTLVSRVHRLNQPLSPRPIPPGWGRLAG